MKIDLDDLRKRYTRLSIDKPQIATLRSPSGRECCVGGAICMEIGDQLHPFPAYSWMSYTLQKINPELGDDESERFAAAIICTNDQGDTDGAWDKAAQALAWKKEK
jgi:hypothetical protein